MRIYIVGPVGSGKTTLAIGLAKQYKIKNYELDTVVWDDQKHVKRSSRERDNLFKTILKEKDWIIEDVGRECFFLGIKKADIIYYLNTKKRKLYFRIVKRWIKQVLKKEKANYKPTIKMLCKMFKWANEELYNKEQYIGKLKRNAKKLIIIDN